MVRMIFRLSLLLGLLGLAGEAWARKSAAGKPAFKPDDPEAVWIWHDAEGWHVRATTGKAQHAFRGVLRGEGLSAVKPTRPGLAPKVQLTPTQVRFEFDVFKGADGFDFQSTGPCLTIELRIDGKPVPEKVHVGAAAAAPSGFPFDACK